MRCVLFTLASFPRTSRDTRSQLPRPATSESGWYAFNQLGSMCRLQCFEKITWLSSNCFYQVNFGVVLKSQAQFYTEHGGIMWVFRTPLFCWRRLEYGLRHVFWARVLRRADNHLFVAGFETTGSSCYACTSRGAPRQTRLKLYRPSSPEFPRHQP